MRKITVAFLLILFYSGQGKGQSASPEDRNGRMSALNRASVQAFHRRDFRAAEDSARRAWGIDSSAVAGAGFAAANVGAALAVQGRLNEALQWQGRAEERFTASGDTATQGRLALARGVVLYLKGEKGAQASLDRAEALLGKDDSGLASVAGEVYANSNDTEKAQASYMRCMGMLNECRARKDSAGVVVFAMRMGCLEGTTGGHDDALKDYTEALTIVRAWRDTARMGVALRNIGLANRKLGQFQGSEAACREALDLARASGNRRLTAEVLNDLSMLYAETGDEARAETTDREAEAALRSLADDLRQGRVSDTVLLDFYEGVQLRFANLPPYDTDLFAGFCDQLVLEPR